MHTAETTLAAQSPRYTEGVLVAEVQEVTPHPAAEKLWLVTVSLGGRKKVRVVCGSGKLVRGQKVPYAPPGCVVADVEHPGHTVQLRRRTIRGVESPGMLCSPAELGLGEEKREIMELGAELPAGAALKRFLPPDELLEVELLANRAPDLGSHWGMARELAALTARNIKLPRLRPLSARPLPDWHVEIEDKHLCSRYAGVLLEGIKIAPSPWWMQERLLSLGLRPMNNVVDITNYVLLELGQPLHAFDAAKLPARKIVVRRARKGEALQTLDGFARKLAREDLVIAAGKKSVALAGVMGGAETEVGAETERIFLEAANFDAYTVRQTSNRHALFSASARRFAAGIAPELVEQGLQRAVMLLREYAGARVVGIVQTPYRSPQPRRLRIGEAKLEKILGMAIPAQKVRACWQRQGMTVRKRGKEWEVLVPPARRDLLIAEDLVEEVGRIWGWERIPARTPAAPLVVPPTPPHIFAARKVREVLSGAGWTEVLTYAFAWRPAERVLGFHRLQKLKLVNPPSNKWSNLRVSLLPNLMRVIRVNLPHYPLMRIFEIGKVYVPARGEEKHLPREILRIAGALVTAERGEGWQEPFYEVKGVVELLLAQLGFENIWFDDWQASPRWSWQKIWHKGKVAEVKVGDREVGMVGELNPVVAHDLELHVPVALFDLDLEALLEESRTQQVFQVISPYPAVKRDISVLVPMRVLAGEVQEVIARAGGKLVDDVDLWDYYTGKEIPAGRKNLTFRVVFAHPHRTPSPREVAAAEEAIIRALEDELGAEVREKGKESRE
jgi:phenylalanyl-tRNA synthetase beta chain